MKARSHIRSVPSFAGAALLALSVVACDVTNPPNPILDPPVNPIIGVWGRDEGDRISYWDFREDGTATHWEVLESTGQRVLLEEHRWQMVEEDGKETELFAVLVDGFAEPFFLNEYSGALVTPGDGGGDYDLLFE